MMVNLCSGSHGLLACAYNDRSWPGAHPCCMKKPQLHAHSALSLVQRVVVNIDEDLTSMHTFFLIVVLFLWYVCFATKPNMHNTHRSML